MSSLKLNNRRNTEDAHTTEGYNEINSELDMFDGSIDVSEMEDHDESFRHKGNKFFSPDNQFESDDLDFDYFPDIAKDEVSVNNIQHDEKSAEEVRERQEEINKEIDAVNEQNAEKSSGKSISIPLIISIILVILIIAALALYFFIL